MRNKSAPTGTLPELLRELQPRESGTSRADDESSGQTWGVVIVGLLHVAALLFGVLAAVNLGEKSHWVNAGLLVGGDVPGRVVATGAVFALCLLAFSAMTFIDATFFLGTSVA